jgi:hypothetical protein
VKSKDSDPNEGKGSPVHLVDIKTRSSAEAGSQKGHLYRPLATRFHLQGFDYQQIAREGDAAIYQQTWTGTSNPHACYEVIRIRRRDGFHIDGRLVEPAEVYPPSEAWGTDGFTVTTRDAAFAKLREICNLEKADGINTAARVS